MATLRSRQEVFNKVWEYARTMKNKAIDVDNVCSYRSPNGPCLIGSLIKDECYNTYLEGKLAGNSKVLEALGLSGVKMRIKYPDVFLEDLQSCHDGASNYFGFKKSLMLRLQNFAKANKLSIPE